jgi:FMN phosphatase YigB (HAD superfamily)|tara:strand:- start:222 stop:392 length:171 start_codon:yes stop_codon:yes gene_type:complete
MPIVIFDLDKTLITGDSDFLWGEFSHKAEIVDADYRKEQIIFISNMKRGSRITLFS